MSGNYEWFVCKQYIALVYKSQGFESHIQCGALPVELLEHNIKLLYNFVFIEMWIGAKWWPGEEGYTSTGYVDELLETLMLV